MGEMVERVAKAIRDGIAPFVESMPADSDIREAARSAIKAMYEPTEQMVDAVDLCEYYRGYEADIETNWEIMIEVALNPSQT
jgi:hypothetical protein